MIKQEFLQEVNVLTNDFTEGQLKIVKRMIEKLSEHEHTYSENEYYAQKVVDVVDKPGESKKKFQLFTIGIKEKGSSKSKTFINAVLNLTTSEVMFNHSVAQVMGADDIELVDPFGEIFTFKGYKYIRQIVKREKI